MCEANVTITADLWKKILWNRAKSYTFWKNIKTNTIIIISLYAGLMTVFIFTKNKALLFNPLWLIVGWLLLLSYNILKTYLSITFLKEDYSFHVKLDKYGVETKESKKPWSHYLFYIEYDDYLEIHEKNKAISYLPKAENLKEILEYTIANIKNKKAGKTIAEEIKEDIKDIEKFIRYQKMIETDTGNFSMGLYKVYKNKELSLRYLNERGFGIIEIGPAKEVNDFLCVDFFKELYESKKTRKPLSIKEQLNFIRQNYEKIVVDLSLNNHEVTFNNINQMLEQKLTSPLN